jgi:Zn-dependent protease
MGLGPFALISLFYLVIGVQVIYQLVRNFRQTFDRHFTQQDRQLVDKSAFFVLLPISVALHELGHAIAIWAFGGQVLDWGFYGFAGYVAFDPREFTAMQQTIVAAAGVTVNLILAAIAVALVFLRKPPMRAAYNELLIQFVWISLLNALIVYPVLDFVTGLNGDWMQMYDFRVPMVSGTILIIHVAVLALLFWAWKSPKVRARIAQLTDDVPPSRRVATGSRSAPRIPADATPTERALYDAAGRVASGWPVPLEAAIQRGSGGTALVLTWQDGALQRSVIAVAPDGGGVEMSGALRAPGQPVERRSLGRDAAAVDANRVTMLLRLAMESVETWTPSPATSAMAAPGNPNAAD